MPPNDGNLKGAEPSGSGQTPKNPGVRGLYSIWGIGPPQAKRGAAMTDAKQVMRLAVNAQKSLRLS